jgi:sigma-B regulation protein RsbU (phosphoserine phosphatase)
MVDDAFDGGAVEPPIELMVTGPDVQKAVTLQGDKDFLIGRAFDAEIGLSEAAVSRRHARFFQKDGLWFIEDLGSRHGTEVGGMPLEANHPVQVEPGQRIMVRPYVIIVQGEATERTTLFSSDDGNRMLDDSVAAVSAEELGSMASRRLGLLMDSAASIQQALDEESLAEAALDAILAGTEFGRALLLRPVDEVKEIELIGSRTRLGVASDAEDRPISRTLLRAASSGRVVRLRDEPDIQAAVSIVGSGVQEALCVPVRIGASIEGYLYLDASASAGSDGTDSAAFCHAIGRLCGLALSNIQRLQLEMKQARLVQELEAAQVVQQRMAPPEAGRQDGIKWHSRVVPGTFVAGDLVCVCTTAEGMPIVFLGDVAGKGAAAGLLMAALEARMIAESERENVTPAGMVRTANNAIMRVTDAAEFVTLWTVFLDRENGVARCVDSGHGYCVVIRADGAIERVMIDGGPPVGVVPDYDYDSVDVPFAEGDRLVIFSDGLAEQACPDGSEMFEFERVIAALEKSSCEREDVELLYESLEAFAGGTVWQDDVTVISLSFDALAEAVPETDTKLTAS